MKIEKLKEYVKEVAKEEMKNAEPGTLPRDHREILVDVLVDHVDGLELRIAKLEKAAAK